jgi:hypothetical protein
MYVCAYAKVQSSFVQMLIHTSSDVGGPSSFIGPLEVWRRPLRAGGPDRIHRPTGLRVHRAVEEKDEARQCFTQARYPRI